MTTLQQLKLSLNNTIYGVQDVTETLNPVCKTREWHNVNIQERGIIQGKGPDFSSLTQMLSCKVQLLHSNCTAGFH